MNTNYPKVIEAAEMAGEILRRYFGESLELEEKSMAADFRTKADTESEEKILEILTKEYPDYEFLSEETGHNGKKSEFQFVIDPLDGTNNFFLGIPNFAVSIALQKNGTTIFGVIYQPITDETYWAELGHGAWLGEKKLSVNSEDRLECSTVVSSVGYNYDLEARQKLRLSLSKSNGKGIKRWGENWSVAFDCCLVATGRVEVMVMKETELHDFAAGKLIAKEAGAKSTDLSGAEDDDQNTSFVLSNDTAIHEKVLEAIKATKYNA
ncbi:MAG: inositol monophosphatase family protein [bacterium]|nr:inositol monophosphatase family protein [bacterium]